MAAIGGPMWFGAVGVGCMAAIGALFAGIFGFLAWRLMHRRLWLAALHLCTALVLVGAGADSLYSHEHALSLTVGRAGEPLPLRAGGSLTPLITGFEVEHYEGSESYELLRHEAGRWVHQGTPQRQGEKIVYEGEQWPVSSLRSISGIPRPFLLIPGQPPRLLLQGEAPVKDYRAACRLTLSRGEQQETQEVTLRVNEPVSCEDWQLYLMSYRPLRDGSTRVELQARRAPGRFLTLLGFIGIALCTAGWCYRPQTANA